MNFDKAEVKDILSHLKDNRDDWKEEFGLYIMKNLWTEVSFDEYCIFKCWCYFQKDEYFIEIQKALEDVEGVKVPLATLQHDGWTLYKAQLGIKTNDIVFEIINAKQETILQALKNNEGGIA